VNRHLLLTSSLALAAIAAALASGPYRGGALVGATSSGMTALASLLFMRCSARASRPVQAALLVALAMFLARILIVALATIAVARAPDGVVAFLVGFFVPYFVFAAIEGAYLHSLTRAAQTPA
jgi:hypothetical protein